MTHINGYNRIFKYRLAQAFRRTARENGMRRFTLIALIFILFPLLLCGCRWFYKDNGPSLRSWGAYANTNVKRPAAPRSTRSYSTMLKETAARRAAAVAS